MVIQISGSKIVVSQKITGNDVADPAEKIYSPENEPVIIAQNTTEPEDMTGLIIERQNYDREDDLRRLDSLNKAEKAEYDRKAAQKEAKKMKKKVRKAQKELIKETELLETYRYDLEKGTVYGLKQQVKHDKFTSGQFFGTLLGGPSAIVLAASGGTGELWNPGSMLDRKRGLGSLAGFGIGVCVFGISILSATLAYRVKCKKLDNPDNKERLEYIRDLPVTLKRQEEAVAGLNRFLSYAKSK